MIFNYRRVGLDERNFTVSGWIYLGPFLLPTTGKVPNINHPRNYLPLSEMLRGTSFKVLGTFGRV